jgi:FAD/FMN-containing dehydrogenase
VNTNSTRQIEDDDAPLNAKRRRLLLAGATAGATVLATPLMARSCRIGDEVKNVSQLDSVGVERAFSIHNVNELRDALSRSKGSIAIGGGRYSMGGQTAVHCGLHLDMRPLKSVVSFQPENRRIRVQAGVRWRELQTLIDPFDLSIRTMQSYANFTVGGSISVNCHGRYVGHGAIAESIESMTLCLANGEIICASREQNRELFAAAIGCYGAVGVIVDATLRLDTNEKMTSHVEALPLNEYFDWVTSEVLRSNSALMHNADLVPGAWRIARATTWHRAPAEATLTTADRLRDPHSKYLGQRTAISALAGSRAADRVRAKLHDRINSPAQTIWRNYEASLDVASLEPFSRERYSFVLEEFFIPERNARQFANALAAYLENSAFGTLNVSIRHAPMDELALMSWAREAVFSFVLYIRVGTSKAALEAQAHWVRALIDLALSNDGTYYLPYRLHATTDQFARAYPNARGLKRIRKEVSAVRFVNTLWEKYL